MLVKTQQHLLLLNSFNTQLTSTVESSYCCITHKCCHISNILAEKLQGKDFSTIKTQVLGQFTQRNNVSKVVGWPLQI